MARLLADGRLVPSNSDEWFDYCYQTVAWRVQQWRARRAAKKGGR